MPNIYSAQIRPVCNKHSARCHSRSLLPRHKVLSPFGWYSLHCTYHEGMARLSWPGWLVTYRDKCLARELLQLKSLSDMPWYRCVYQMTALRKLDGSSLANHPPIRLCWKTFLWPLNLWSCKQNQFVGHCRCLCKSTFESLEWFRG